MGRTGPRLLAAASVMLLIAGCFTPGAHDRARPSPSPTTSRGVPIDPRDPGIAYSASDPCIFGRVQTVYGDLIANATIHVIETNRSVRSNSLGEFRVCRLFPNWYTLQATHPDYRNETVPIETRDGRGNVTINMTAAPRPALDLQRFSFSVPDGFGLAAIGGDNTFRAVATRPPSHILLEATWSRSAHAFADTLRYNLGIGAATTEGTMGNPARIVVPASVFASANQITSWRPPAKLNFDGQVNCGNDLCWQVEGTVYITIFYDHPSVPGNYTAVR